jgi:hypothetical protein
VRERPDIRVGQPVRDLDGSSLGRVARLYDEAFLVVKGPPILFRTDQVIRYDEIRGERDGALVVARSPRSLFQLAAGQVPEIWQVAAPRGFPSAATPDEARGLFEELAAARRARRAAPAGVGGPVTPG